MWQRRVEFYFLLAVGMSFQHSTGYFKDRMTPVPAWGVESGKSAVEFLDVLETHLKDNTYLCGEYFSVADITLLCALDFARVIKIRLQEQHPNLQRWYALVSSRESAKA
jgi:glutathione S-transferase